MLAKRSALANSSIEASPDRYSGQRVRRRYEILEGIVDEYSNRLQLPVFVSTFIQVNDFYVSVSYAAVLRLRDLLFCPVECKGD